MMIAFSESTTRLIDAAFCPGCGRAVGFTPRHEWLHLDGVACTLSPWLAHGDHDAATWADLALAAVTHAEIAAEVLG